MTSSTAIRPTFQMQRVQNALIRRQANRKEYYVDLYAKDIIEGRGPNPIAILNLQNLRNAPISRAGREIYTNRLDQALDLEASTLQQIKGVKKPPEQTLQKLSIARELIALYSSVLDSPK